MKVFSFENAKTPKGESMGWRTAIRYLAPAEESGFSTCPQAGACKATCLYSAGRGRFLTTQSARVAKTHWRFLDKRSHLNAAVDELRAEQGRLAPHMRLCARLNGTSDLPGDAIQLAEQLPEVQFYDYTKIVKSLTRDLPENYHLTLSYDPQTVPWETCQLAMRQGFNVAVVFDTRKGQDLPAYYSDIPVLDGDETDLRFLDKSPLGKCGCIIGLRAKGLAKLQNNFVVEVR